MHNISLPHARTTQTTIAQLKADASRAFATKDYVRATKLWDEALSMGPSDQDVALIHNNKAACHMVKKRWSQAVEECTLALDRQPEYVKALLRRGKAYESMREYLKAQEDYGKAAGLGNTDAKVGEARVRKAQLTSAGGMGAGARQADMAKSLWDQFAKMGAKGGSGSTGAAGAAGTAGMAGMAGRQQAQDATGMQAEAWLIQLVQLLKKYYGLDIEKPIIEGEIASDKVNAAMLEMMNSEGDDGKRVDELLEDAGRKYKEQVAFGMAGEASVKDIMVDRITQRVAREGADVRDVEATIEPLLEAADKLLVDAIAYCPARTGTMVDLMITRSQFFIRRANLKANYVVEAVPVPDDGDGTDQAAAHVDAKQKLALEAALKRITGDKESLEQASAWFDRAIETLEQALNHVPGDDAELLDMTAEQLKNSVLITMGNTHYEASLLKAGGGLAWRGDVQRAKAAFEQAQAPPVEIRDALLRHFKASEMDDLIGEEIVVVQEKKEALPAKEGPKGLPSLKKKKPSK